MKGSLFIAALWSRGVVAVRKNPSSLANIETERPAECNARANPGCNGLAGLCCPHEDGAMLACCHESHPQHLPTGGPADCNAPENPGCHGLSGLCCPHEDGAILACCYQHARPSCQYNGHTNKLTSLLDGHPCSITAPPRGCDRCDAHLEGDGITVSFTCGGTPAGNCIKYDQPVKISYKPSPSTGAAMLGEVGQDCPGREYRLASTHEGNGPAVLKVLSVDKSGKPTSKHYNKADLRPFQVGYQSIWDAPLAHHTTEKLSCLRLEVRPPSYIPEMVLNQNDQASCTTQNTVTNHEPWHFQQQEQGNPVFCLGPLNLAGCPDFFNGEDLKVAVKGKGCDPGWKMEAFEGDTPSLLSKEEMTSVAELQSCESCRVTHPTFACSTPDGCRVAASSDQCKGMNGKWCVERPRECNAPGNPGCHGLAGLCCPHEDGMMLECCHESHPQHFPTHGPADCNAPQNPGCHGLAGLCCPHEDGAILACCYQGSLAETNQSASPGRRG